MKFTPSYIENNIQCARGGAENGRPRHGFRIVAVAVLAEVLLNEPALTRCSDMLTGRPEEQQCWRLYPRVGAALPPGR